jgi:hypothetical protein
VAQRGLRIGAKVSNYSGGKIYRGGDFPILLYVGLVE